MVRRRVRERRVVNLELERCDARVEDDELSPTTSRLTDERVRGGIALVEQ